jgi:hypothetical protein
MSTDIGVIVLSGILPLLGVLVGSGSTIFIQRSSARESRIRAAAERRQAQRAEVKSAIDSYLEVAQHLQTQLYAGEHGREVPDIAVMVEQTWLAQAQVEIICSEGLRRPLEEHAIALNEVARHKEQYPDWWGYVYPYKRALHDAIRKELRWRDDEVNGESPLSLNHAQTPSDQGAASSRTDEETAIESELPAWEASGNVR